MKTFVFYLHLFGLYVSHLVFIYLFKFLATRLAPPFENPAYATRTGVGNLYPLGCIRPAISNIHPRSSSVARGGAGGARAPPHWVVKYAKSHVFCAFEVDFLYKMENSPPMRKEPPHKSLNLRNFGRKIALNFGEDLFFFFGDHLILVGKNL